MCSFSDAQKYYTLRLKKDPIQDGLFSRTRNPSYLGEIMIYTGFAVIVQHWLPFVVILAWVVGYFSEEHGAKGEVSFVV